MATHSSILAWRIPWMEEPGRLQSTGSQRVGHDWATSLTSQAAQWLRIRLLMQDTPVRSLGGEDSLEKGKATHFIILAGRIPWTEETGGQRSTRWRRVGHDWTTKQQQTTDKEQKRCWMRRVGGGRRGIYLNGIHLGRAGEQRHLLAKTRPSTKAPPGPRQSKAEWRPCQSSNQAEQWVQRFPTPRPRPASVQRFPRSTQERGNRSRVDTGRPAHTPSVRTEVPLSRAVIGREAPRKERLMFVSCGLGKGRSSPPAGSVPPQHQAGCVRQSWGSEDGGGGSRFLKRMN